MTRMQNGTIFENKLVEKFQFKFNKNKKDMKTAENNQNNSQDLVKTFVNTFFYTSYKTTKVIAILSILMFIFETFYPLGDIMENNFGIFGTWSGYAVAIYCWYNFFRFVCLWAEKNSTKAE